VQVSAESQPPAAVRHTKPGASSASAGQAAASPLQVSAGSHVPADTRQVVPPASSPSVGQVALAPLHDSAASHTAADARHSKLVPRKLSPGHVVLEPVQVSATSQPPAAGRHTVDAGAGPALTQVGLPVEHSTVPSSHGLPVPHALPGVHPDMHAPSPSQLPAGQAVPMGLKPSTGHVAAAPVQVSAWSQTSTAVRHSTLEPAKPSTGQSVLVPSQDSVASQGPADARHSVPAGAAPAATQTGEPVSQAVSPTSHGLPVPHG